MLVRTSTTAKCNANRQSERVASILRQVGTFIVLYFLLSQQADAQVSARAQFDGIRVEANPPVTGTLKDITSPIWTKGLYATGFADVTTRELKTDRTDVYLVFGRDAIYCAFVSEQSSPTIVAKQTLNNAGLGLDDYVSLMFDTSGNGTNQYFFETTPLGVRYQAASESSRYNPVWTAKASIDGDHWIG